MATDTERREVARMLRDLPGDSTYPDLVGVIADRDGWYPAADAADRLADLIEPSCDRDALLELAEDVSESAAMAVVMDDSKGAKLLADMLLDIARRIREACGEVIG